jgi:hypothetical protein
VQGRVGADDDGLLPDPVPRNDGESVVPSVRMVADGLEVAVVGRLLLRALNRTLGAVDIERHAPGGRSGGRVLDQFRIEASKALGIVLLGKDLCLELMECRGERDARVPPRA